MNKFSVPQNGTLVKYNLSCKNKPSYRYVNNKKLKNGM